MKSRIALLESIVLEGKPYTPGEAEFWKAIEALSRGDKQPMADFKRNGGVMPHVERPETRGGHRQSSRSLSTAEGVSGKAV